MQEVSSVVTSTGDAWGEVTGRSYAPLEQYRTEDAELLIVTMGSMSGTVREAVDALWQQGSKVGLLKVRLFRPFPAEELRQALKGIPTVLVFDRNYSPGMGGILHQELKAALYNMQANGMQAAPKVHGLLTGVGGINVSSTKIQQLVADYQNVEPSAESIWVE